MMLKALLVSPPCTETTHSSSLFPLRVRTPHLEFPSEKKREMEGRTNSGVEKEKEEEEEKMVM